MDWCYLYHLSAPLGNAANRYALAQHYLGTTPDVARRDALHRAGRGARILAAAVERGIDFRIVRLWPGGREVERWLKARKEAPLLCPVCSGAAAWRRAVVFAHAEQLVLPLDDELAPWDAPGYQPPAPGLDWYEATWLRHCRTLDRQPLPADWDAGVV